MTMHPVAHVRDGVRAALVEHGAMTSREIATKLNWDINRVKQALVRQRQWFPGVMFRVSDFREVPGSLQRRPTPMYSAEGGDDMTLDEWRAKHPHYRPMPEKKREVSQRVLRDNSPWSGLGQRTRWATPR